MEGKRHLGAAIGTEAFKEVYVREKVAKWVLEVDSLMTIALTQPHATYVAFTHGLAAKWNYLSRTISGIAHLFQPLEDIIRQRFLPTLTGQNTFSDNVRDLTALPSRLGGLGITNPVRQADSQHATSQSVTAPLVKHIIEQSRELPVEAQEQLQAKHRARYAKQQAQVEANNLLPSLSNTMRKQLRLPKKKEPSHGLPLYQSQSMGSLSTKEHFVILCAFGMDGNHYYYHRSVFVTRASQWNMH